MGFSARRWRLNLPRGGALNILEPPFQLFGALIYIPERHPQFFDALAQFPLVKHRGWLWRKNEQPLPKKAQMDFKPVHLGHRLIMSPLGLIPQKLTPSINNNFAVTAVND